MKKLVGFILIILLIPPILFGADKDQDTFDKDGLFVNIALISDWQGTMNEWKNPSFPDTPIIKTETDYKRGDMMVPFITYSTDGLSNEGKALITYDIKITKPNNEIYVDKRDLTVINGIPPKGYGMFQQPLGLRIENDDPFGVYKMTIIVKDHIKKKVIDFTFYFNVIE